MYKFIEMITLALGFKRNSFSFQTINCPTIRRFLQLEIAVFVVYFLYVNIFFIDPRTSKDYTHEAVMFVSSIIFLH